VGVSSLGPEGADLLVGLAQLTKKQRGEKRKVC